MEIGDGWALRVLQEEDEVELFSLVERSREHLRVWLPDVAALSRGEISDFLRRASERRARGDGVFRGICVGGGQAHAEERWRQRVRPAPAIGVAPRWPPYSLFESAKLAGIEPKAYLRLAIPAVLRREMPPLSHECAALKRALVPSIESIGRPAAALR